MISPSYRSRHRSRPARRLGYSPRSLRVEPLETRLLLSADLQLASILGVTHLDGEDVVVQALYAPNPAGDAQQQGLDILANYGARPFQSADFSLDGWSWDQFFDTPTTNDFVTQFYNAGSSNTKPEPSSLGGSGQAALLASQVTWTSVTTSTFAFDDGGTTDRCPSLVKECKGSQFFDGFNDVAWLRLGRNTLGVTWFGTSIDETDVALNTTYAWSIGGDENTIDVETVFLHENGHVVGLGHSGVAGAVMQSVYAGPRRVLHQDDIDGISSLYPAGPVNEAPTVAITSPSDGVPIVSGATIDFAGTASDPEDGDLTADLLWTSNIVGQIGTGGSFSTTLSDGNHTITASVTDSGGETTSESISFTVGTPTVATSVSVESITYASQGGKNGDNNLTITVGPLIDDLGSIVSDAPVRFAIYIDSSVWYNPLLTTGADGTFTFSRNNVPAGTYTTIVESVTADGLAWDGITPPNSFTKPPSNNSPGAELSITSAGISFSITAHSGRFAESHGDSVGSTQTAQAAIDHGRVRSAATARRAERPTLNRAAVDASIEAMTQTPSVLRPMTASRQGPRDGVELPGQLEELISAISSVAGESVA